MYLVSFARQQKHSRLLLLLSTSFKMHALYGFINLKLCERIAQNYDEEMLYIKREA